MGIGDFYKQRKPSKFRYVYRYYDPKQEEMEKKIRRAERKLDPDAQTDAEEIKDNLRGSFRRQSQHLAKHGNEQISSRPFADRNFVPILLLVLGVVLLIWLFNNLGLGIFEYIMQAFR